MRKRGKLAKAKKEIDRNNIKAMANSMRVQILTILNERMNSATRIAKELGADFGEVNYEMEVLRKMGRIEVAKEVKRRGAVEVYYRAVSRAMFDAYEWPSVPDTVKGDLRASLLQTLTDDAIAAIVEDTYDSLGGNEKERDAHMSWTPVIVDEQGWNKLMEILERALLEVIGVHNECTERLIAEDTAGISCTISMLGYRSAHEQRKVGPPIDAKVLATSLEEAPRKTKKASKEDVSSKKRKSSGNGRRSKTKPKGGKKKSK